MATASASPAHVVAVRRAGAARRAELLFAEGLPSVEMDVPFHIRLDKGDTIHVALTQLRAFSA